MARKSPLVTTSIRIEKSQLEWIEKNHFNLSSITRAYLEEFIATMEKVKEGVVVPAWIKVAGGRGVESRKNKKQ